MKRTDLGKLAAAFLHEEPQLPKETASQAGGSTQGLDSFGLKIYLFLERGSGERQTLILLFHLCIHSLVASCMCPARGSNLQPWGGVG